MVNKNKTHNILFAVVSVILLTATINYSQQNLSTTKAKLNKIFKHSLFNSCVAGIEVYDLSSQKTLYKKNSNLLLHPASTNKLITSVAGLYYLGPNYSFKTSVYYSGNIIDSVCYGDLFIVGGSDPDLVSEDLDSIIIKIKKFGIKEIAGNLYGDVSMLDSLYWGNGWMWDDDPSTSAPYLTPLTINDNGIKFYYQPDSALLPAVVKPNFQADFLNITNRSISLKSDSSTFSISRDWMKQKNEIKITGILPLDNEPDSIEINFIHPEFNFIYLFNEKLNSYGIKVNGVIDTLELSENAKHIFTFERKLNSILPNLNKESDNLSAELLLRTIGYEMEGKRASFGDGLKYVYRFLYGLGYKKNDFKIVDGSGLSHYNLITASQLVSVLKYIYLNNKDFYNIIYNSLPIAGIDGTLENRMTKGSAFNNVRAKTGTLSGVTCLAGYLTAKNKHKIAFSILMQNHVNHTSKLRRLQDSICEILSNYD